MGRDDLLISYFLKVHDFLRLFATAKFKGKQILTLLHSHFVEIQTLHKTICSHQLLEHQVYIYELAITNAKKTMCGTISSFEEQYLSKLMNVSEALSMIQRNMGAKTMKEYMSGDLEEKQKKYWLCLMQLREIARNLAFQYEEQKKLICSKWENICSMIFKGLREEDFEANLKEMKLLILHTSFETEVETMALESWDNAITGLQSKRYQI